MFQYINSIPNFIIYNNLKNNLFDSYDFAQIHDSHIVKLACIYTHNQYIEKYINEVITKHLNVLIATNNLYICTNYINDILVAHGEKQIIKCMANNNIYIDDELLNIFYGNVKNKQTVDKYISYCIKHNKLHLVKNAPKYGYNINPEEVLCLFLEHYDITNTAINWYFIQKNFLVEFVPDTIFCEDFAVSIMFPEIIKMWKNNIISPFGGYNVLKKIRNRMFNLKGEILEIFIKYYDALNITSECVKELYFHMCRLGQCDIVSIIIPKVQKHIVLQGLINISYKNKCTNIETIKTIVDYCRLNKIELFDKKAQYGCEETIRQYHNTHNPTLLDILHYYSAEKILPNISVIENDKTLIKLFKMENHISIEYSDLDYLNNKRTGDEDKVIMLEQYISEEDLLLYNKSSDYYTDYELLYEYGLEIFYNI